MHFFGNNVRKGAPVSTNGFVDGIIGMAHALENLSVFGGKVSWSSDGVPKIIPGTASGATLTVFEIVTVHDDYLMCAAVASFSATMQPIPVAIAPGAEETLYTVWKPWALRKTPFDGLTRDGIGYAYDASGPRLATRVSDNAEEWQEVTPSYVARDAVTPIAGDVIYAATLRTIPKASGAEEQYIDANLSGRCWAVTEEPAA